MKHKLMLVSSSLATAIGLFLPGLASAAYLEWAGNINGNWDTTTPNWVLNNTPYVFVNGDTVSFTDTAVIRSVHLSAIVQPGTVYVGGSNDYQFTGSGRINGNGGIYKDGSGTLTLANQNDYTGNTTVNAGTLLVNGKLGNTVVFVYNGATLGGSGTIQGDLYVSGGATLAPSAGGLATKTLTISNYIQLSGTTVMLLNKSAGSNDLIRSLSSIYYGGTLFLTNRAGTLSLGDHFKLFDAVNYNGSVPTIVTANPGVGLLWDTSQLMVNGTIAVALDPLASTYDIQLHPGLNLIANQLDHGSNTLNEIAPDVLPGSILYKFDNANSNWTASAYNAALGRWSVNLTLNPGEGAFFQSPSNAVLSFIGWPHVPVLPVTIPAGSAYLLSRQTNDIGTYENIVGSSPSGGETVFKWTGSNFVTYLNDQFGGGWAPSVPTAAVGESVWVSPGGNPAPPGLAAAPVILSWPKTKVIARGSNVTFSATVVGLPPISFQWFRNGSPIPLATSATFNIASVSRANAGYYTLSASNVFGVSQSPSALLRQRDPDPSFVTGTDFGDLPAPYWTCWEQTYFGADCGLAHSQYTTASTPSVTYPTTLAQNGARHSWSYYDPFWLGSDVTPTSDGIPNATAKGDPYESNGNAFDADFSTNGILQEENGIRMIPPPFDALGNPVNKNLILDPRTTVRGTAGLNLFGYGGYLFTAYDKHGPSNYRACYKPGETVWFAVEFSSDVTDVGFLNVWIDYGKDDGHDGDLTGAPDGKFQPKEYVIVDQPLWQTSLLQYLGGDPLLYPFDSAALAPMVASDLNLNGTPPAIGLQPYAGIGVQVVSFTIPANLGDVSCGKRAFARFRVSRQPLNLFRKYHDAEGSSHVHDPCSWPVLAFPDYNTYHLKNAAGQTSDGYPDPSLGEVNDAGEVEDYMITFHADCNSGGIFGPSSICMSAISTLDTITTSHLEPAFFTPPPASVGNPIEPADMIISVIGYSSWPTATLADSTTWFYIKVTASNASEEIMQVQDTFGPSWTVSRDVMHCTGSFHFDSGAIISWASRCQCQLDGGQKPGTTLLNVSSYDPGVPCAIGRYPFDPVDPNWGHGNYPFVVQVLNSGSADLSGVSLHWTLPTDATFIGAAINEGTWARTNGGVTFNLDFLGAGQTAEIGLHFLPKASGIVNHLFDLVADQPLLGSSHFEISHYVQIQPRLTIQRGTNNTATVDWPATDSWILQQSPDISGGWTNAPSQVSPLNVPFNQAPRMFFRLTH